MLLSRARDLPFSALSLSPNPNLKQPRRKTLDFPMRTALGLLRSISASSLHPYRQLFHHHRLRLICNICLLHSSPPAFISFKNCRLSPFASLANSSASVNTLVEQVVYESDETRSHETWDFSNNTEVEAFDFDGNFGLTELKQLRSPSLEVKELEELPELWRRSKLAWLCKELPAHKASTVVRILNAQRKWMTQEDATYVAVHCMRIRENESGYRVYKWMMQQRWFRFDFALATKLADYVGRERKYLKCREIFDDIINQGIVPNESTFHILTVSYLSSNVQGCLEEACNIYNRMIQLGDYNPRLSLHNSLFRALVSQKPGGSSKNYLKQAEFIFHNLSSSGLEIHKDIYGGLIWLHSYQEEIDKKRISEIRAKMEVVGIEEGREVLVSILRAFSKDGDVEEVERIWTVLITNCTTLPSQAFVYKMQAYAKIGEPMKSLEIFRGMNVNLGFTSVAAYHKMIEILCKSQKLELAESIMSEFISSGLKPLMPSFVHLMDVYLPLGLHDKLEKTFLSCLEKCRPNRYIYCIYLDSLVKIGNLDHAELIFGQMYSSGEIGVNPRSCNAILRGYLSHGEYLKAEKIYDLMCEKKFDIETPLMQKMDYVLSLSRKIVKKPTSMKLNEEQREILVGLLLGGLRIQSDEARRNHVVCFQFNEKLSAHSVLKRHIYDQYHEWLSSSGGIEDVPYEFTSISHSYFGFYADQFWPKGHPAIPKLIHRWLSPRVLAYWYMYGGHRTPSGDILLKVKSGSEEGVEKIVKALKAKSLDCRVKKKGKVFWLGFLGNVSSWFWKLIEPFVLDDLKDVEINFDSGSDSDDS